MTIGYGLCECGCGQATPLARQSVTERGWVRGQPIRFIKGHSGHRFRPGETAIKDRWREEDRGYQTLCWIWLLCKKWNGYGVLTANGHSQLAHRYLYEQAHGSLSSTMQLDHLCRQRDCVNPAHLEPVTHAENSRRGRNTKLTAQQVEEIRSLLADGWPLNFIGPAYGVTPANISSIKLGLSWTSV